MLRRLNYNRLFVGSTSSRSACNDASAKCIDKIKLKFRFQFSAINFSSDFKYTDILC